MRIYNLNPIKALKESQVNWGLIVELIKREVAGKYKGSILGYCWSLFNPILMLVVYTFVFSVVFQARWGNAEDSKTGFALVLFAGLIIFNFFSECFNRAPTIIVLNVNYVKKIIFPLEILPIVTMGAALVNLLISFAVWFAFHAIVVGLPPATSLLLPVIMVPLILMTLGLSWLLSSLGVYLRDAAQITASMTTVLMFLSPIFYPLSNLPEAYRTLFLLNPLTTTIEQARAVLIYGQLPDWTLVAISTSMSLIIFFAGFAWFQKTRRGFADVL